MNVSPAAMISYPLPGRGWQSEGLTGEEWRKLRICKSLRLCSCVPFLPAFLIRPFGAPSPRGKGLCCHLGRITYIYCQSGFGDGKPVPYGGGERGNGLPPAMMLISNSLRSATPPGEGTMLGGGWKEMTFTVNQVLDDREGRPYSVNFHSSRRDTLTIHYSLFSI